MFPLIGSGRFITAPVITEDGEPIQDPIVLQQMDLDPALIMPQNGIPIFNFELVALYSPKGKRNVCYN